MKLHEPLNKSKADSEAAACAVERLVSLYKQVENLLLHIGRDSDPGVLNPQLGAVFLAT